MKIQLFLPLFLLCIFSAVATEGESFSRHAPLYNPGSNWRIVALHDLRKSGEEIKRIEISIVEGNPTDCKEFGRPPSVIPCRRDAISYVHTCLYSPASYAICRFPPDTGRPSHLPLPTLRHQITYQTKAITTAGKEYKDREITFTAGLLPMENLATPIWWHRNVSIRSRLDLGFFPAKGYGGGDYKKFSVALNGLLGRVFFRRAEPIAENFFEKRHVFNFWLAPRGASIGNRRDFPRRFRETLMSVLDGSVILHEDQSHSDSSTISYGGEGSAYAPSDLNLANPWIFVHESGHFLFGLGDEYCGGGTKTPVQYPCQPDEPKQSGCSNLFRCRKGCEDFAGKFGLDAKKCAPLSCEDLPGCVNSSCAKGVFRVASGKLEIMRHNTLDANWRMASRKCVASVLDACDMRGGCYSGVGR